MTGFACTSLRLWMPAFASMLDELASWAAQGSSFDLPVRRGEIISMLVGLDIVYAEEQSACLHFLNL